MKKNLLLFIIVINSILYSQSVPIAEIRENDANGVPIHLGEIFTVSGVVGSSNQFGSSGPGSIHDQSAGISVFGNGFAGQVSIGDSVTITSTLSHYNGLTEFDFNAAGSSFINHGQAALFDTTIVTISQVINQEWNGLEIYEGRLIRINNVTITGSGSFTGSMNYPISDGTGNMELRIDGDVTTIIGTQIPTDPVDLIGILGQFDQAAPYNSGYQILPRFILDIAYDGTPLILEPVFASNIDTSSFTVYFNTARNGNSKVKYGLTTELEKDSVVIDDDTTYHVVSIEGLTPGTLYYFRAYSSNDVGESSSNLYSVTTNSTDTTTGKINVYFNFSIDSSIALPNNVAKGNVVFKDKLIERINAAVYSIDMALYSFSDMPDVANAVILAKDRGVKVRVVYDDRTTQNSMQSLIDAGIPVIKRNDPDGIMHNKFFVFDARDVIPNNDWIWTGSWNVTLTETSWKNNVVEINDPAIASAYKIEFEEMWGSSTDTPNLANARFGRFKSDNTQHEFLIGGIPIFLYFSPSDGTTNKIINIINTANDDIYMALYVITRDDIGAAIIARNLSGVDDIRGVIDQPGTDGSEFDVLQPYAEMLESTGATLHHKYSIIDALIENSDPIVETGSHNWSSSAENDNDENVLIIHDFKIANLYLQEYKNRYNESGGTTDFIYVTNIQTDDINNFDYRLYQNFPNPFNPVTTIRFEIPSEQRIKLSVFDILGREVKILFDDVAPQGIMTLEFDASEFASGVYFYKIQSEHFTKTQKLILMK